MGLERRVLVMLALILLVMLVSSTVARHVFAFSPTESALASAFLFGSLAGITSYFLARFLIFLLDF